MWDWVAQGIQAGILIILCCAFYYAKKQLNGAEKARKLQATRELINELGSEDLRKDRWWVLYEMDSDLTKLSKCELWRARRVAVAYDRVGFMVKQGLVQEDALFDFQKDEIKMLWEKLEPIVKEEQKNRPNHCKRFEYLYKKWLPLMEKSRM